MNPMAHGVEAEARVAYSLPNTGREHRRLGCRRRVSIMLLTLMAAGGLGFVNAAPALALCSGESCNYTDPAGTGCADPADVDTPDVALLSNGGMTVSDIELRYSYSCRTVWSRLTHFYSSNGPWANRVGGGPDTYWLIGGCSIYSNPWDITVWSPQINDAGYLAYAWGGVTHLDDYCGVPTYPSSLQSYNAAGPY
jgi:hypothetical protein